MELLLELEETSVEELNEQMNSEEKKTEQSSSYCYLLEEEELKKVHWPKDVPKEIELVVVVVEVED